MHDQQQTPVFLNLDVALSGSFDLSPLVAHWQTEILVLRQDEYEGKHHLSFETMASHFAQDPVRPTATEYTTYFLAQLAALPEPLRALWQACDSRVFDYGFASGHSAPALSVDVGPSCLAHMAQWGIAMRITVYPNHADGLCPPV